MQIKREYKAWLTDEVQKFSHCAIGDAHKRVSKTASTREYWECFALWLKLNRFIIKISHDEQD
jgi:hypothetical protein